jgi:g-D-glutamyl-meso-diaminopimelate peptidase
MNFKTLIEATSELSTLKNVDTSVIGHSVLGHPIHAFHVGGYCDNQIIVTAAIHAREWITALLTIELVKIYSCKHFRGGIYFIPLCNPDGVQIALDGDEPLWKANACGVDLNVNFDADWGGGAQNVRLPGPENYIGPCPNSEPETQTLIEFTRMVKPKATVAYHSKGELIYFVNDRDTDLANKIGELTGFPPERTQNSTGGYSDWVSRHLGIPALTIEVGTDDYPHPIGVDKLSEILNQNKDVPMVLLSETS